MIDLTHMTDEDKIAYAQGCEKETNRINFEESIDMIIGFIKNNQAASVVRLGDGEIDAVNGKPAQFNLWNYPGQNKCENKSAKFLKESIKEAIVTADMTGIFLNDCWTFAAINGANIPIPKNIFYAFSNLHWVSRKRFVDEILRKKKLLLIGSIMNQWSKILKEKVPEAQITVFGGNSLIQNEAQCTAITEYAQSNKNYDVALVSMGVWAGPICSAIKKAGKIGIDYGHAASHQNIGEYSINNQWANIDDYYKANKCPMCMK